MDSSNSRNFELLQQYFDYQVTMRPHKIALICNGTHLTYAQLQERAHRWANYLYKQGIRAGHRVGIWLPRGAEIYPAILAVLKLGAAYVPLDPDYPAERVRFVAEDCQLQGLISSDSLLQNLAQTNTTFFSLSQLQAALKLQPDKLIFTPPTLSSEALCYIIYTSGTTGNPKGVAIRHRNVCHFVQAMQQIYQIKPEDRVYQGFSIAFDASIEEIWGSFANGATLVAPQSELVRAGGGLSEFLNQHKVSVFSCVPTLLSQIETDIPSLRLLIMGGEVCPPQLVAKWYRPNRRMINTYGPTETTVVATYSECLPDKPITIGKPLPHYEALIVDENLQPVAAGQVGELCIGGAGVAEGYINQPQLTQQKFIAYADKTLYRTGDLVQINQNQEIEYIGRKDQQIKLRGFRIELNEIEQVLMAYPGVKLAIVAPQTLPSGVTGLIAYMVMNENIKLDNKQLRDYAQTKLPPFMVPSYFAQVADLPRLSSGKIDRQHLPTVEFTETLTTKYTAPRNPIEQKIAVIWQTVLQQPTLSVEADFFEELGGHSLSAAKIVSQMRQLPQFQQLSLLDIYHYPTIAQLAEKIPQLHHASHNTDKVTHQKKWIYYLCGCGQALGSYINYAILSWQFLIFYLAIVHFWDAGRLLSWQFASIFVGILLLYHPVLFLIAIISKWLILGRIKPGEHRLWGGYYFRWWLAQQCIALAPIDMLAGSPLINVFYRCLGAKIGKNCYIGTPQLKAYDLISIADGASIGTNSDISGYIVENGYLKIGSISIGKNAYVGCNSTLGIHSSLQENAKLGDQSCVLEKQVISANESYMGSPAQPGTVKLLTPLSLPAMHKFAKIKMAVNHYLALLGMLFLYTTTITPSIILLDFCYEHRVWLGIAATPFAALLFVLLLTLGIALAKKIVLPKQQAGIYALNSSYYLRTWFVQRLMSLSLEDVATLYATLYLPAWLRLLGAKIGRWTEISTAFSIMPDLLRIEGESFIADNVILGATQVYQGCIQIFSTHIGARSFVGNSALVPAGATIPENCLLGCLSIAPQDPTLLKKHASWFGSPAMLLPHREVFVGFSDQQTYHPTRKMYVQRVVMDFLRVISQPTCFFIILILQFMAADSLLAHFTISAIFALFPFAYMGIVGLIVGAIAGIKWVLMQRYQPRMAPAWSFFVWRNELLTGLYDAVVIPLLEKLLGTPFINMYLRGLGVKIGKQVYIESPNFTEFDLITIGNQAALNRECIIQTHLFEDRIQKMSTIKIGDDCSIGKMSVVLYDTQMQAGSTLGNLSLLMKGEILPAHSHWQGIPAQPTQNNK